ncbi:hypothetical protein M0R45_018739 [Rubus argutus]|uniref:Srp40 C-terminal domain-containing protein n=1 Tax=Rubus argutus TaxID=59490 RepID=A0AAW1X4Z0_RUBAR
MPKSLSRTQVAQDSLNPTLLAFKPRQVLLANREMKQSMPNNSDNSAQTLRPHQKGPLLHAVARFLEGNGFSKTLKKFRSEAEIEKNGMKDSSLDLEEMYCKYSGMCNKDNTSVNIQKENGNDPAPEKIAKSKDKKKNRETSDSLNQGDEKRQLEPLSVKGKGASDSETEKKSKDKKKKKNKSNVDSVNPNIEQDGVEAKQVANGTSESIADENLVDVKPKGKKKKKESSGGEDKKVVAMGDASETILKKEKENFKISDVDATDNKENKGSKKRKRLDSESNDSEHANSKEDEESKRRKVEALKESKGSEQPANTDVPLVIAEQLNENLDKSAEKFSMQKSMKKQRNGSTEPKTVIAFQRVKVDEVVFTDEKLKDNSYWAKDGAEIGYGAKAQEILGQVRGRDFRHEKTKKKRGTYRGGQIDLQSHSVKFNYSDED